MRRVRMRRSAWIALVAPTEAAVEEEQPALHFTY